MALPLYAITLFVSAFLLFLVQPMIGKMILPKLGGTPQVWNTCMLFFQTVLLAGYAYTHNLSTRMVGRRQFIIHAVLLFIPLLFMLPEPFNVRSWFPDPTGIAVLQALGELAIVVGVPFFVVSTSAPLLQKWFIYSGHPAAKDPYFLYGASNLGSLLSLVCYPFLIEPYVSLHGQALTWMVGYCALIALVLVCVGMVWKSPLALETAVAGGPELSPEQPVPPPPEAPEPPKVAPAAAPASTAVRSGPAPGGPRGGITRKKGLKAHGARPAAAAAHAPAAAPRFVSRPSEEPVTWFRRVRWILLAAVPSSLMLGVTSFISTDLSPFPLIWIVPLALYLLSFILVFLRWPVPWTTTDTTVFSPHTFVLYVGQPLSILALCWILLSGGFSLSYMFICWGAFFLTALACHGEIARDRPDPRHLTEYFLWMSVGGALGGFFNGIVAPAVFPGVWEFYIALVISCFVRPTLMEINWLDSWLMNTFPGLRDWARDQSDQFSRSMGRTPDGSTYVLSYTLDVLLGVFVVALVWLMNKQMVDWELYDMRRAVGLLRFLGFSERGIYAYRFTALYMVIYGIPLALCLLFSPRPVRFGLAVTAVLWINLGVFRSRGDDETLYQGRTYFGVLRVLESRESLLHRDDKGQPVPNDPDEFDAFSKPPAGDKDAKPQYTYKYTYLMHGTTYHGRNYIYRPGSDNVDLSRLATTYYHRYGPTGAVMEKFNWIPGPQNTFWADNRIPAATVGNVMANFGASPVPYHLLLNAAVSEPPYATIGLGTGTMASYCRPYQHLTFYEIDRQIRDFSLPPRGGSVEKAYFTYLLGAMRRGANLEIIMGDARLSIERPQVSLLPFLPGDRRFGLEGEDNGFAQLKDSPMFQGREHYYKAIEVDAFSSDAIPVHLITKEAIELYLSKITHDGVVMVHTSNRHLDLVQPVAKIVELLDEEFKVKYKGTPYARVKCLVGKDQDQREKYLGHFSSEYVMVYYDEKYLKPARNYTPIAANNIYDHSVVQWRPPEEVARYPWTDDFSNLWSILR